MSLPSSTLSSTITLSTKTFSNSNFISAGHPQSSAPVTTCSSITSSNSSSSTKKYTSERIKLLLKQQTSTYTVIKNEKTNSSLCWKVFGFPAKKSDATGEYEKIEGFTSCQTCNQTFAYTPSSGTRNMLAHQCVKNLTNNNNKRTTSSSSSTQPKLNSMMNIFKKVKLNEKEINTVKDLACSWICRDMRSFKIIEDNGLKQLLQEFVILGSKYGEFDVANALRGADAISDHIYNLANEYRSILKDILQEPLESGCICVSPDLWSDDHKKIPYLGITATFVTKHFEYKIVDLCCKPFLGDDHSGKSLLIAIQKALEPFGIYDLSKLSFMSDRGANLIKALEDYETLFCFPHRINNVLKRAFFQLPVHRIKTNPPATTQPSASTTSVNNLNDSHESASEDEEILQPTKRIRKKKQTKKQSSSTDVNDPMKLDLKDLPVVAREIIETIKQCKKLVRYIKKNGLNKTIQENGGVALQQSTVVRWLSLINLLESLVTSYEQTKRILNNRRQQAKLNKIDEYTLKQLICLLKPFKHVLQLVQKGDSPSLYMVLPMTLTLKKALSSFDELLKYQTTTTKTTDDKENSSEQGSDEESELLVESEGFKILRLRVLELFNLMFELDLRHYTATLLHPCYRQLRGCSNSERDEVHLYVREEMKRILYHSNQQQQDVSPEIKKRKVQISFLQEYEDDNDLNSSSINDKSSGSEDYSYIPLQADELTRYLSMELDKSKLSSNPLEFWKDYQGAFPILSVLARQIHCIPASSAAVERCFSSSGFIVNERRACLSPDQLDNIIVIRSVKNLQK
ncbi:unnamed protein product [Adineta steineri]|uniref:HAT C-terminal dimerisation domain-containing protein n=1 Tax=Adineta steineri TaxID=433720 RepID=A0A814T1D6_9BILA|nr:unnamed protein product [Adineta steineri]